jgi:tRNA-specific 2-thiouridylase
MGWTSFERHLQQPRGRGPVPDGAVVGSAGGAPCNDLVRLALRVADGKLERVTFEAEGCGATIAAASACVELVEGKDLLSAALIDARRIATALGGLSPGKLHAADLVADALHRTLTNLWATAEQSLVEPSSGRMLVAMSGGVDSAVAAVLTEAAGYDVVGVTLKLWADRATDGSKSCCSPEAVVSARSLAHRMGMPHLTLDLSERFRDAVVNDFLVGHDEGQTPNPCIRCNGEVRFDAMLRLADLIGARSLITGHYARIVRDEAGPLLASAADPLKDQTYMLAALTPELLERVRFPLGDLRKPQVRDIARSADLPVAEKKESQDLCFMAGTTRRKFLARHGVARDREGEIVDRRGALLGHHRGHRHYTVGQRRGLGVASAEPLYVLEKDASRNRVVVGRHDELAVQQVLLSPGRLHRGSRWVSQVRLRYRSGPVGCEVGRDVEPGAFDSLTLTLRERVHGVAPGQTACLLDGDRIIGYGTIMS